MKVTGKFLESLGRRHSVIVGMTRSGKTYFTSTHVFLFYTAFIALTSIVAQFLPLNPPKHAHVPVL